MGTSGTLTVANSTISGNTAGFGGGGVDANGTLTVTNSTISGNTAGDRGGGVTNRVYGTMTVTNSTSPVTRLRVLAPMAAAWPTTIALSP